MTKDEALKLALEALENISTALREDDVLGSDIELMLNTIAAIKEALHISSIIACRDALDAQPVPRRWVGLTDEDVYPLANEHLHYQPESYEVSGIYSLARAIEAKLREKNA